MEIDRFGKETLGAHFVSGGPSILGVTDGNDMTGHHDAFPPQGLDESQTRQPGQDHITHHSVKSLLAQLLEGGVSTGGRFHLHPHLLQAVDQTVAKAPIIV